MDTTPLPHPKKHNMSAPIGYQVGINHSLKVSNLSSFFFGRKYLGHIPNSLTSLKDLRFVDPKFIY